MSDKYQNYLREIINSQGSETFRHSYISINGEQIDVLENGWYACAFFVSSILKKFNLIWRIHRTVGITAKDMILHGWYPTKKLLPGNVIIWEKKQSVRDPRKNPAHIGFYLGEKKAISNVAETGSPAIHHFTYGTDLDGSPKRKITKILTHRFIREGIKEEKQIALIKVEGNLMKVEYEDALGEKKQKEFKILARKEPLEQITKGHPYFKDKYWDKGGPCLAGEYYLYLRKKNDKKGDRIEFCQNKPKKLIKQEHYIFGINVLGLLEGKNTLHFTNSANRTNIQIHGGDPRASKGCLIIEKEKEFYDLVISLFERGIHVKIQLDDYWQTEEGRGEMGKMN